MEQCIGLYVHNMKRKKMDMISKEGDRFHPQMFMTKHCMNCSERFNFVAESHCKKFRVTTSSEGPNIYWKCIGEINELYNR